MSKNVIKKTKVIIKRIILLNLLFLIAALTACTDSLISKESNSGAQPSTHSSKTESKDTLTFTTGETAVFDNLKITANEITEKTSDDSGFISAENGKTFVGVQFTVENISDEEQAVSSILLFEAYCDDVKCDYSFSAAMAFPDGTIDGSIAPGKKLTGWYAVEIPSEWSSLELHVASSWLSNAKAVFIFNK